MADRPGFRARLRYATDRLFSRGTPALIATLAVFSVIIFVLAGTVTYFLRLWPQGETGITYPEMVWRSLMSTIDSGTIGGDNGWGFRFSMLVVTVGGIFVFSTLIGVLTAGIETRLATLRRGRSPVIESGHTVILGWSEQVFTIVSELVIANENQHRPCIVILGQHDKVEMEDELREKVGDTKNTRVVCRSGDPMEMADLTIAAPNAARSIIVLSPTAAGGDAEVIKVVLALINHPDRRKEPFHIVAALRDARNYRLTEVVGGDEVEWLQISDLVARVVAQTCRQSGLSTVYTGLMSFEGDEMYFTEQAGLYGKTFADSLLAFETNAVLGLAPHDAAPLLNPPMDTVLRPGDQLVVIAEDDDQIFFTGGDASVHAIDDSVIVTRHCTPETPEHTLVLGWNGRGADILRELGNYAPPGSDVLIVEDTPAAEEAMTGREHNLPTTFRRGDTTDRDLLEALEPQQFDHIILLSDADARSVQEADAATLITLLHLRDMADRAGQSYPIVSEMLDLRNRRLAEIARADDYIVSDHLVSLIMTQVSENKLLSPLLADIFDADGSELYLKPAGDYVHLGVDVSFATIVEAAKRRGQCAIGYRRAALAADAGAHWGVVVNPAKSSRVAFADGDRVVVAAED